MDALVKYLTDNSGKGLWVNFVILTVYLILKKELFHLIAYYTDRRDKHYDFAQSLLGNQRFALKENKFLCEILEGAAFYKYNRICAETRMRSGLILSN